MAKVALSTATTISQAMTNSHAPPHTPPSTIASTGIGYSWIVRIATRRGSLYVSGSGGGFGSSPTLCPADHVFEAGQARKITTRTPPPRKRSRASSRSLIKAPLRELSVFGSFNVMVPIWFSTLDLTSATVCSVIFVSPGSSGIGGVFIRSKKRLVILAESQQTAPTGLMGPGANLDKPRVVRALPSPG